MKCANCGKKAEVVTGREAWWPAVWDIVSQRGEVLCWECFTREKRGARKK